MTAAFQRHQMRDKGFGPAAGPLAGSHLVDQFRINGHVVLEGESPWRLERTDRMLMYRIADPGPGFSFENLDHAAVAHDNPIDHVLIRDAKGLRPGGYGVLTARASVDELLYNQKQNEVIFIKYLT